MDNNNQIIFENDPFNHIDLFSFSDFDTYNVSVPIHNNIEDTYKIGKGHLALLNPQTLNQNSTPIEIAMKMGIDSILSDKQTPKYTIKQEKEKATKNEPKKRGRKSTAVKSKNDNKRKSESSSPSISEEENSIKLPEKYSYLEEKERMGTLTDEEEKLLKKERRLIKNRESAQQFRKRQKQHTMELQDKVHKLTDENINLKHHVEKLEHDKLELEKQIKNVWSFVHKAFTFAVPYKVENN